MFGLRSDSRRPRFHPKRCSAVETRGSNRFLISEESDSSGYGDRSMISGNGGAVMICISGGSGRGLSRSHDPPARPSWGGKMAWQTAGPHRGRSAVPLSGPSDRGVFGSRGGLTVDRISPPGGRLLSERKGDEPPGRVLSSSSSIAGFYRAEGRKQAIHLHRVQGMRNPSYVDR